MKNSSAVKTNAYSSHRPPPTANLPQDVPFREMQCCLSPSSERRKSKCLTRDAEGEIPQIRVLSVEEGFVLEIRGPFLLFAHLLVPEQGQDGAVELVSALEEVKLEDEEEAN